MPKKKEKESPNTLERWADIILRDVPKQKPKKTKKQKFFRVIFGYEEKNDNVEQFGVLIQASNRSEAMTLANNLVKRCVPKRVEEVEMIKLPLIRRN